jgi:hypothetical protein
MKAGWMPLTVVTLGAIVAIAALAGCHRTEAGKDAPATNSPAGPSPSTLLKNYKLHSPPPLASATDVSRFLDWAGASHVDEREDARKAIAAVADRKDILDALVKEVEGVQTTDHTRALLALALLGETRSPTAQEFFAEFARRPLPAQGTVIEGEIIEQTRAAQLQAKAVDGLAYANTDSSNRIVTQIIAEHPSKIVRAEAINAYLWNHGDSDAARKFLSQYVRKDELILLDRVRRNTGETAESFNNKLAQFLKQHPEVMPPPPEKQQTALRSTEAVKAFDAPPPAF